MNGAGKYDDACTQAHEATQAQSTVLIVVGGEHGHGFSAISRDIDFEQKIPQVLRDIADAIERDNRQGNN